MTRDDIDPKDIARLNTFAIQKEADDILEKTPDSANDKEALKDLAGALSDLAGSDPSLNHALGNLPSQLGAGHNDGDLLNNIEDALSSRSKRYRKQRFSSRFS